VDEPDGDVLDKLAQSIADGDSIDWQELEKVAGEELRNLLQHLRLVSDVAEVHRSPEDPSAELDLSTRQLTDHLPRTGRGEKPFPAIELESRAGKDLGRWGHLLLRRKIGEGAFGIVYHAHDPWLDHPVALKLLRPEVARPDFSSRILHEARKLARVRHPNVVTVHGADHHDGQIGFWMELIEGQTLAEIVAKGRLNAGEAAYMGQEVCRALAAVHNAGLIHRDVKAQNVMRASDGGRIILMDFGAGEFVDDPSAASRVQGTPLYLAPEILEHTTPTVQTDIYATGVLLHFLVTGGFPVTGSSIQDLTEKHRRGERRRLQDSRPDLPDSFVSIVERALQADPARRYASAGDMLVALAGEGTAFGPDVATTARRSKADGTLQKVGRVALTLAAAAVVTEILGLVASRAFETALRVEPDFAAGPVEYFSVGLQAALPFVLYWLAGAALLGVLAGISPLFRKATKSFSWRWIPRLPSVNPSTLAAGVFLAGVAALVAITWKFRPLFDALGALFDGSILPVQLSVLSTAARPLHRAHANYSAFISFLLGLAALRWFPRMEKQAQDASRVRFLKWATLAVAFLVVALEVFPRRVIWERFEVVSFENRPAFVIGSSTDELFLYARRENETMRGRVRKNAATLQRTGKTALIFDPQ
jgi:tRNA A-37 threonylcarbamoyl transferase component Bud32